VPSTKTLAIKWNREDLGWSRNESVDIQLFGYYEDIDGPHWDFLQVNNKINVKNYLKKTYNN
jgi:hypothetical protein